jgi:two-component system, cell cycle sensor histidine kinase and response regulator CckA
MPRKNSNPGVGVPVYETCAHRAVCDEKRRSMLVRHLQAAQKSAPVATMAAGLAHDFKNIMTTVRLHSDLIGMSLPADASQHQNVAYIREAVEHANELLERLVRFARPHVRHAVVLHADEEIADSAALLEAVLGSAITLKMDLRPCVPVQMDPVELQQIVLNCAVNARQAMRARGVVRVSVRALEISKEIGSQFEPPLPGGRYVEVAVTDDGPGMSSDQVRSASSQYHASGLKRGWGLGLAVVHGCAARAGGGVRIESEAGAGTRVAVALPAVQTRPATRERRRTRSATTNGRGA